MTNRIQTTLSKNAAAHLAALLVLMNDSDAFEALCDSDRAQLIWLASDLADLIAGVCHE